MTTDRDLGVALSGGGHRATVFGLGVLLALVDQRLNERVVSISSVSGGSIANGIVMVGPDFGTAGRAEFEAHIAPVLAGIADRGILLGGAPATRGYVRLLTGSAVTALLAGLIGVVALVAHWWVIFTVAAFVTVVAGFASARLFGVRSLRTEQAIDAELLGGHGVRLSDLRGAPSSVHHVICTTELQTGTQFYFSNRLVYGYGFSGTTAPLDVRVATAVQASACVPGAFAPRTIPLATLGLSGDGRLVVDDGGVYDNMADEWEYGFSGRRRSWPELVSAQQLPAAMLFVANASGGWDDSKPIRGNGARLELAGVLRAKDVQYDVSTAHRRRALAAMFRDHDANTPDGVFAQISASPYTITRQFGSRPDFAPDDRSRRADAARQFLDDQGYTADEWTRWARQSLGVPTTLAPLGRDVAAKLLEHGYVLTLVNLYVLHRLGALAPLDRDRFARLCER